MIRPQRKLSSWCQRMSKFCDSWSRVLSGRRYIKELPDLLLLSSINPRHWSVLESSCHASDHIDYLPWKCVKMWTMKCVAVVLCVSPGRSGGRGSGCPGGRGGAPVPRPLQLGRYWTYLLDIYLHIYLDIYLHIYAGARPQLRDLKWHSGHPDLHAPGRGRLQHPGELWLVESGSRDRVLISDWCSRPSRPRR